MTVLLVTGHLSGAAGGLAASVPGLATALGRRSMGVHIAGIRDPEAPEAWRAWKSPGVEIHALAAMGPRAFGWTPCLRHLLQRLQPDLVHVQGAWMYQSLASLRRFQLTGRPYLVSPRGMLDPWALRRGWLKKYLAGCLFEQAHLRSAACLHALAPREAEAIRAYGLRNPVCVIPNGVDLPMDGNRERSPRTSRTLLFLGRIDAKKGVRELLLGWQLVARDAAAAGWRLRIMGWGDAAYIATIARLRETAQVGDSVMLEGPAYGASKAAAFAAADAFVLPSRSEGLPMAVLEAWSHGVPVVMTPACNLPEGFAMNAAIETGQQPETIAATLRRLFSMSAAELAVMGGRGRRLVEEQFTWERAGRSMAAVYDWVLHGGPTPACVMTD